MAHRARTDRTGRGFTTISVDIDTYRALDEIARREERSISWVVKRMVKEQVEGSKA